jgi:glutathione S-transferase
MLPATLIAGLAYPKAAAATSAVWLAFRVLYATGYTRADKENGKGRLAGLGFWLAQLGAFLMVGKMSVDMILA